MTKTLTLSNGTQLTYRIVRVLGQTEHLTTGCDYRVLISHGGIGGRETNMTDTAWNAI